MNIWQELYQQLSLDSGERSRLESLLAEYNANAYLTAPPTELLDIPDNIIIAFYAALSQTRSSDSPVKEDKDSSWMADTSFCFVNIRACGKGNAFGTILDAARILPGIRSEAIHLGPFTSYDFECIYAVSSVRTVAREILHPGMLRQGISGIRQIRALVQAGHLLGKCMGYDLEPHVTSFAIPVMEHPEFFRWIRVHPDGHSSSESDETILSSEYQEAVQREVRQIVQEKLIARNFNTLEVYEDEQDRDAKQRLYFELIHTLIDGGYWTIPVHSWKALGLPQYKGYDPVKKRLSFHYLAPDGEDVSHLTYNIVTPFAFYKGLEYNQAGSVAPIADQACLDYFSDIFPFWQRECDFDFVRYDSVDHIFDSCQGQDFALSDRPTPRVLQQAVAATKKYRASAANLAERMGQEISPYAATGFDSMLGVDMFHLSPRKILENAIQMSDELARLNRQAKHFSLCLATDTHDTGNPGLIGAPLVEKLSARELIVRHFMARFLNIGAAARSKYEVMGYQDKSHGLFHSNVHNSNLNWTGDRELNKIYHQIEDLYSEYKKLLYRAHRGESLATEQFCVWQIRTDEEMLVCVVTEAEGLTLETILPQDWLEAYEIKYGFTPGRLDVKITDINGSEAESFALLHFQKKKIYQRITT